MFLLSNLAILDIYIYVKLEHELILDAPLYLLKASAKPKPGRDLSGLPIAPGTSSRRARRRISQIYGEAGADT